MSEICRAEQLRALRHGKCVIPLLAQRGSELIPLHLECPNYLDFSLTGDYARVFDQLLEDMARNSGAPLTAQYRETYVTAPPLPANYVERPELLQALRNTIITDSGARSIALTALEGMAGIGKSVLAQALCHDEVVQQAFPDGVIWVSAGKESSHDLVTKMREVGKAFEDDLDRYDNELGCRNQYRSTIRKKAALVVVDDVWQSRDIEPFRAESPRSRLVFTTRIAEIAAAVSAREYPVTLPTERQSRDILANSSTISADQLPSVTAELIEECGRLPLALSMVGAMLRGKPNSSWKRVLNDLRSASLEKIRADSGGYPHKDLLRAIQVSVDDLDASLRKQYVSLAVLPQDMPVYPAIQQTLWNVSADQAEEIAEQFISLSLAQPDPPDAIRLHDLQLDFVRGQYPLRDVLDLVRDAVRLSSHVISKDPSQFASQVTGRLLPYAHESTIQDFLVELKSGAPRPWIRLENPALTPPGTGLVRTLEGHSAWVEDVAITPDGRRAVSASWDHTIKVWDLETGREVRTLQGHSSAVRGVALTPDGRRAVSASWDQTLKVWDLETGRELCTLKGHHSSVLAVAVSSDGQRAVSASWDQTLKVWDLETGRELQTLRGHSDSVRAVALTPNGRIAVSGSSDNTLKVWDLENGQELRTFQGHSNAVLGVDVSPDGCRAVSAGWDNTVKIWDLENGRELYSLEGHSSSVLDVAVSPDARHAVSASSDKTLKLWNIESGRELRTMEGHSSSVLAVSMSPDGQRAVSASWDRTLKVWKLDTQREMRTSRGHSSSVLALAVSPLARRAVSASSDSTMKVWDLDTGRELTTLCGHTDRVNGVAIDSDGHLLVSASWDKTLKVWDLDTAQELRTLEGHRSSIYGVALSANGRRIISASEDDTLKVWDCETGREVHTLSGHSDSINGVAISPDGRIAVSASSDHTLKVWDCNAGCELRALEGHSNAVLGVALTPNGRRAVSAGWDHRLKLWDLESGSEIRALEGHSNPVLGVALSADGRRAVSASWDNTLKVWDLATGCAIATFTCDSSTACCAFASDQALVAGDGNGRVLFLWLELEMSDRGFGAQ